MKTMQHLYRNSPKASSIALWKVDGELDSPIGNTTHCHSPFFGTSNAVFSLSSCDNFICQNPSTKSIFEKYLAPAKQSNMCSMLGNGYASSSVSLFNLR